MNIDDKIINYCIEKSTTPSLACSAIENYTKENVHGAHMMIGKLEASFLGFLIKSADVKKILEFGTFTGYSALAMAELLPPEGELTTVDINVEMTSIAQSFWSQSTHGYKIKALNGNGLDLLKNMTEKFDLIFIDADKKNYLQYLKTALSCLTPKGMIVIDNVLWGGRVCEELTEGAKEHRHTKYIQELNDYISREKGLYGTLLPLRDGLFLIKKDQTIYQ